MSGHKVERLVVALGTIFLSLIFMAGNASAVPSFARQTGQYCSACHTLFPELTPFGRAFKLGGYTLSKSDKPYEMPPPIAAHMLISYSNIEDSLPPDSVSNEWARISDSDRNDFFYVPQEVSLFYAGRIYGDTGAFIQGTYSGVDDDFFLDMTDIRYANNTTLGGKNLIYGITVNNSPTVEDPWNSTPTWGIPAATSDLGPTPAAGAIIDGGLDQQVGGIGVYGYWNDFCYANLSVYRTAHDGVSEFLGAGTDTEVIVDDAVPYWRLALQHQWNNHSLEVGTYGLVADIFPEGTNHGDTDRFTDIALDAQYQWITENHIFSVQSTWIHEDQDWDASFALGDAGRRSSRLDTFRINFNYYYKSPFGQIGGTAGFFSTTGSRDDTLYAPEEVDGSRTGKPDSDGIVLEVDYLPFNGNRRFLQPKFSLQYIAYDKFNGAHSNYDGFGRDASDNNTLFLLAWIAF